MLSALTVGSLCVSTVPKVKAAFGSGITTLKNSGTTRNIKTLEVVQIDNIGYDGDDMYASSENRIAGEPYVGRVVSSIGRYKDPAQQEYKPVPLQDVNLDDPSPNPVRIPFYTNNIDITAGNFLFSLRFDNLEISVWLYYAKKHNIRTGGWYTEPCYYIMNNADARICVIEYPTLIYTTRYQINGTEYFQLKCYDVDYMPYVHDLPLCDTVYIATGDCIVTISGQNGEVIDISPNPDPITPPSIDDPKPTPQNIKNSFGITATVVALGAIFFLVATPIFISKGAK